MKRFIAFLYGILCYLVFFASFLWLVLFLGDFDAFVPTTVNSGTTGTWGQAVLINLGLIALFGLQHHVMARQSFKKMVD